LYFSVLQKPPLRLIEIHDSIERFPYNNKYHLSKDYIPRDLKNEQTVGDFAQLSNAVQKNKNTQIITNDYLICAIVLD